MKKGFSLVEMAVVISIIGLLVGAIVAGNNIKKRLQLNQVVTDVGTINTALQEFIKAYSGYPGDLFNAEDKFGASSTNNGNGDSDLDSGEEQLLFWQHLALSGLITGSYDGVTDGKAGKMEAPIKAGFYNARKTSASSPLFIRVSKANDAGLFTPKEAYDYDVKYDDGSPETGSIRAVDGAGETAEDCVIVSTTPDTYKLTNNTESPCVIDFYLEQ